MYSLIEPEMSQSATTGGARSTGARKASAIAPPGCNERRKLRRGSMRSRRSVGANRRMRRRSSGITSARIALARRFDLGRAHLGEILGAQDFQIGHGEAGVEVDRRDGFPLLRAWT